MQNHRGVQVVQGCLKDRIVSKLVWGTEENVIFFECVQHEDANGRNVHVEIHSIHVMKTTLKLYKDHRKILEFTAKFYQADEKEGQTEETLKKMQE